MQEVKQGTSQKLSMGMVMISFKMDDFRSWFSTGGKFSKSALLIGSAFKLAK
jgi:hypothetical protein